MNVGPNSRQLLKVECRKWTNRVYGFPCIFGSPRKTRQLFAKVGVPRGTPPYLTKPEELQKRLLSYCREGTTLNGRQTNFYLGVPNLCFLKLAIMHCRIGFAHFLSVQDARYKSTRPKGACICGNVAKQQCFMLFLKRRRLSL